MLKKIFTREVKVALMVIFALVVLYFGLNFLKGINIFKPTNHYYAVYEFADGLVASNPVYIKGYKVGQVTEINCDFAKDESFVVQISVQKDLKLPKGTKAELFDDGLMGGKAIRLVYSDDAEFQEVGDTLGSESIPDIIAQFVPRLSKSLDQIDSLVYVAKELIASKELKNSLASIEKVTSDLSITSTRLNKMMDGDVASVLTNVDSISSDLKLVSGNLKSFDYQSLFIKVDTTVSNLQLLSEKINDKDGSLGLLMKDKTLYEGLNKTVNSANSLLTDLKENPKRYVHFSLFGKKSK